MPPTETPASAATALMVKADQPSRPRTTSAAARTFSRERRLRFWRAGLAWAVSRPSRVPGGRMAPEDSVLRRVFLGAGFGMGRTSTQAVENAIKLARRGQPDPASRTRNRPGRAAGIAAGSLGRA